jgi:Tfp pilus assembly PilM family ATPase
LEDIALSDSVLLLERAKKLYDHEVEFGHSHLATEYSALRAVFEGRSQKIIEGKKVAKEKEEALIAERAKKTSEEKSEG